MSLRPEENSVTTPDHVENTGDNLRHAAEVTRQSNDDRDGDEARSPAQDVPPKPLPDFNT
jgi:hypothetical protein